MANNENLKPWKPGQSGNPKGRPKNRVINEWLPKCFGKKRAKAMESLLQCEVDAWEQRLLVMTSSDLAGIAKCDEAPIYAKNLAMAILFDTKNGKTATIDRLRDRQYERQATKLDITTRRGDAELSTEELTEEIERLMKARNAENEF